VNRNLQRTYRRILYSLKKQYGDEITICQNTSVTTNYVTGTKSYTCSRTKINKAILLPINFQRKTDYDITAISANKMFVFGATFDVGSRIIIVDIQDVPTYFQLDQDDWILIDNTRYEIGKIEQLEYRAGWIIGAKQIVGANADLEVSLSASDDLSVSDSSEAPKNVERSLSDSVGLSDSENADRIHNLSDSLSLTDTEEENKEVDRTLTDDLGLTSDGSYIL